MTTTKLTEPWTRTAERTVWRAAIGHLVLTVSRLTLDGWQAEIEGWPKSPDVRIKSPICRTRLQAQAWAELHTALKS
jgi:hypothetical protein